MKSALADFLKLVGLVAVGYLAVRWVILDALPMYQESYDRMDVAPFRNDMRRYLDTNDFFEDADATPYVRGKLLPVSVDNRDVDVIFFMLDKSIRPRRAAEVKTVARIEWGPEPPTGEPYVCTVTIADMKEQTIVGRIVIDNESSDTLRKNIADYLNRLERR